MTIKAVGVDERTLSAIALFFEIRLESRYAFRDAPDADIWLFDVDSMDGRTAWDTHRTERTATPAILVSIAEKTLENAGNAVFVLKPLSTSMLSVALERVALSPPQKTTTRSAQVDAGKAIGADPKAISETLGAASRSFPAESAIGPDTSMPDSVECASEPDTVTPRSSPYSTEPDTFMPDSEWYEDPIAAVETPDIASPVAEEAAVTAQEQRSERRCATAAMRLDERNARGYIGSTPDIDAGDPRQVGKAQYDPDRFLAGTVSRAAAMAERDQRPVSVAGPSWSIVIRPNPTRAFVNIENVHLRTLATLPLQGDVNTTVLSHEESKRTYDGVKWRMPTLQWMLTLMAARGRVPVGTDLNAKVKLMHWPNLTRLQAFPNAMRIASLWSRQPVSLMESAAVLGIPQRYVFSFYSAVQAIGVLDTGPTEPARQDRADNQPAQPQPRRSLFRKILAHLRLG
ncbi:MAG: hypothetical protein LJE70_19970 [Chromatiaceae bacterium]|nr:hypothetical protein [Chromatiaceae bacterium]